MLCIIFSVASAYSGLKVGQVMESAIPISILAIGLARHLQAPLDPARKRNHHRHRRRRRIGGRRRGFHRSRVIHSASRPSPRADHLYLPGGWMSGRSLPDSSAALLRARHARPASLSRSHCHHRSVGHRRKRRIAGQVAAAGDLIAGVYDFFVTTFQVWKEYRRLSVRALLRTLADAPAWSSASTPSASFWAWAT